MANYPTKFRAKVQGTTGRAVRFPPTPAGTQPILGVNVALPDGSIPSIAQLVAYLQTVLVQSAPGNITIPSGPSIINWANITGIPPSVSPGFGFILAPEADPGEDNYPLPGPTGAQGPPGPAGEPGVPVVRETDDPDDVLTIPGPTGPQGLQGAQGEPGVPVFIIPDDADDQIVIPGMTGLAGLAGAPGAAQWVEQDDPEQYGSIPGAAGARGPIGFAIPLWPDDVEDPLQIQGPQGNVGATGATGVAGPMGVALMFEQDDPEAAVTAPYTNHIPGAFYVDGFTILSGLQVSAEAGITSTNLYGSSGQYAALVNNQSATAGTSFGLIVRAGTNSSDFALVVQNQASQNMVLVEGSGNVIIEAASNSNDELKVIGSINAQQFNIAGAPLIAGEYWNPSDADPDDAGVQFQPMDFAVSPQWTGNHVFNAQDGIGVIILDNALNTYQAFPNNTLFAAVGPTSSQSFAFLDAYNTFSSLHFRRAGGTSAAPSNVVSDLEMGAIGVRGYGTTGYSSGTRATMVFQSTQAWSDTANGVKIVWQTTPNNSITTGNVMSLDQDGGLWMESALGGSQGLGTMNAVQLFQQGVQIAFGSYAHILDFDLPEDTYDQQILPGKFTGSFTGTLTGCTTSPTGTVQYTVDMVSGIVILTFPAITGTSNSNAATITGLPSFLQPASQNYQPDMVIEDNTALTWGQVQIAHGSGTMTLLKNGAVTFTTSGTKGVGISTVAYALT